MKAIAWTVGQLWRCSSHCMRSGFCLHRAVWWCWVGVGYRAPAPLLEHTEWREDYARDILSGAFISSTTATSFTLPPCQHWGGRWQSPANTSQPVLCRLGFFAFQRAFTVCAHTHRHISMPPPHNSLILVVYFSPLWNLDQLAWVLLYVCIYVHPSGHFSLHTKWIISHTAQPSAHWVDFPLPWSFVFIYF